MLLVHLFVYFVRVSFCHFSLLLGVGGWLRFVIVALPGLFSINCFFFFFQFSVMRPQQVLPKGASWVKTTIKNIPKNAFVGGWEDGGKRKVYIGEYRQNNIFSF